MYDHSFTRLNRRITAIRCTVSPCSSQNYVLNITNLVPSARRAAQPKPRTVRVVCRRPTYQVICFEDAVRPESDGPAIHRLEREGLARKHELVTDGQSALIGCWLCALVISCNWGDSRKCVSEGNLLITASLTALPHATLFGGNPFEVAVKRLTGGLCITKRVKISSE